MRVFSTDQVEGSVFEWSTLVAIAFYLVVAWAIVSLIRALGPRTTVSAFEESEVLNDQVRVVQVDPDTAVQREQRIVDRDRRSRKESQAIPTELGVRVSVAQPDRQTDRLSTSGTSRFARVISAPGPLV